MLIKFFARGRGSGSGPVDYVCHTEGREHAPPEVLRGDAVLTKNLIDSIDREWRYTSGVISFSLEDAPTLEQQEQVMDEFEKAAFAGLEPDQYDVLWVRHQHTEGGRVELHFVTPRMELTTGKALNIAPPNWDKYFQPLQNALNYENQWADPNSPEYARNTQKAAENALRGRDRESIGKYIETLVEASLVTNRAEIIKALEEAGLEITRRGKDYISVKDTENPEQKAFRLKGAIYGEDWTAEQLSRPAAKEAGSREATSRRDNGERAANARRELENNIRKRAEFNSERYKRTDERIDAELEDRLEADNLDFSSLRLSGDRIIDIACSHRGDEENRIELSHREDRSLDGNSRETQNDNGESGYSNDQRRTIHSLSGRDKNGRLAYLPNKRHISLLFENSPRKEGLNYGKDYGTRARIAEIRRKLSEWYEAGRAKLTEWFQQRAENLRRAIESSRNEGSKYREQVNKYNQSISSAIRSISDADGEIGQAIERIRAVVKTKPRENVRERDRDDDFEPEL